MMTILCSACSLGLRVNGDPEEAYHLVGPGSCYWPDKYTCFQCEGRAHGMPEQQVDLTILARMTVIDVSPQEAFAALNGMGVPTEKSCTKEDLNELFDVHRVKRVIGRNIVGTTRCIVDALELDDGTKVYLDASTEGATAYRVTRPHSYVKQLENDNG